MPPAARHWLHAILPARLLHAAADVARQEVLVQREHLKARHLRAIVVVEDYERVVTLLPRLHRREAPHQLLRLAGATPHSGWGHAPLHCRGRVEWLRAVRKRADDVVRRLRRLRSGSAGGRDAAHREVYRCGDEELQEDVLEGLEALAVTESTGSE